MVFGDKLIALAEKCLDKQISQDGHLEVRENRRVFGVLPRSRVSARIKVCLVNDEWRVMLSDPTKPVGPFWGADYSTTTGDNADAALLAVWIRESDQWQRCTSTDITSIGQRIANAVDLAYTQYIETQPE